jgi:DNA repair exonuclease SbcCD ATPase subunit
MSYTDEIYRELMDGLNKGLDWQHFLDKHGSSKGPLYNAVGRVLTEVEAKIEDLNEERSRVQTKLDQAGITLDSLDEKIEEAQYNVASLEDREHVLSEQVETLEARIAVKEELVGHLAELEKLGFSIERLKQLQDALKEMGRKHGLTFDETISKFFGDLKEYEDVLDAESELKRLQTLIETKKLEAENWQAKEEAQRRKWDNLYEGIKATQALFAKGIKASEIISWHRVLSRFQSVEQFSQDLAQYGDMTGLLKAKKEEIKNCELKAEKAQSRLETLEKEAAKIEGAIDALKITAVKELKKITEETTKQVNVVAAAEIGEVQAAGLEVKERFNYLFAQLDNLEKKIFEIGRKYERISQNLQKYDGVKEVLESLLLASEQE